MLHRMLPIDADKQTEVRSGVKQTTTQAQTGSFLSGLLRWKWEKYIMGVDDVRELRI